MRGRQAQERPVLRPVRPRLGHPRHPRRPDPGVPGPDLLERVLRPARPGQAARACTTTSAGAPGPACRRSPASPRSRYRADVDAHGGVPGGQHEAGARTASDARCGGRRAPGVRAGRQAARPAGRGAARDGDPGDGAHPARGPRRDRAGGGRPRGGVPGVLRPRGPGARPPGLGGGPGRGPRTEPSWWRRSSGSSTWSATRSRRGSWCRRCPADREVLQAWLAARRGSRSRSASRSEAPSAS